MRDKTPLAERLRPKSLEAYVGQSHLRARLEGLWKAPRLPSLLLFGPPGCGKSSLAMLLAEHSGLNWVRVSAPEAGLAALRGLLSGKELLVLDEVHRFSKAQQDFFLPLLETGEITLIATTTENPSFTVTKQLLSRLLTLSLHPLSQRELLSLAHNGLEVLEASLPEESLRLLTALCGGDARSLFNLMEYALELPEDAREPEKLRASLPELRLRADRDGDTHYELASAFIKSIRGSDPDAALYYLACLLEGGEDPRFVCRRLILSASEDIGLGDPRALPLAVACAQAVEMVGMPEGFIPMSETTVYLALAPKSNSTYAAYLAAKKEVLENGKKPVPLHLRNAVSALQRQAGYGKGYLYPHAFEGGYVTQDYLPGEVVNRHYYQPKEIGEEPKLTARLKALRKKGEKHS